MEFQFSIRTECMLIVAVAGLLALVTCMTLGCSNNSNTDFTGTYVNSAGSEFSIANDTLIVERTEGHSYFIHRKTGFQLLNEKGRPGKKQYEKEKWTASYDPETELMIEKRHGKIISFNTDRTEMTVVRRIYRRIN